MDPRRPRLTNTFHSEILPSLYLPSLPACLGAADHNLGIDADEVESAELGADPSSIAELLRNCDVSYLNLNEGTGGGSGGEVECSRLYREVLECDPEAFVCSRPGPSQEHSYHNEVLERKSLEQTGVTINESQREHGGSLNDSMNKNMMQDPQTSDVSRKLKIRKKESERAEVPNQQGIVGNFCEMVEEFCGRAEDPDDLQGAEGPDIPLVDIKNLVKEIMSVRTKKVLQLIPIDTLVRLMNVLDRQIQYGQDLSPGGVENLDPDAAELLLCAMESTHAALAVMTNRDMPKQLYKEEIIERIIDFSRRHISEFVAASRPLDQTLPKQSENAVSDGEEDEENYDGDYSPAVKKRRQIRSVNVKKSTGKKVSATTNSVIQKLCTILGLLKDLLSVVHLAESCILQLVKTCFSTFLVDSIQLLQLKSINLICGIVATYRQHRSFLMDEMLQLLRKSHVSKRAVRAYHLPVGESKQIQMTTALLIHLVQFSANLPEKFHMASEANSVLDASVDASFPTKCLDTATEACCVFWTNVLQRLSTSKAQDVSESRVIFENLVEDLLTTLNLPEYPTSALILEVLCVLLLQNAGLKSKDISARCMAIDLLGTIAARMKGDALMCSRDIFWISQDLVDGDIAGSSVKKDTCSVCLNGRGVNVFCKDCQRCFHADCIGQEIFLREWSCHICLCKKQLATLKSCCKLQSNDVCKKNTGATSKISGPHDSVTGLEVVQQIFLNYLEEVGPEDGTNLYTRWFYLCLWYKDDPLSQDKVNYYLARLESKAILRDSGSPIPLTRDWAKRICLALAQKNTFSRGFDKILSLLLASMRESSPVLRAKALRAVSVIVESDPEVLYDKRIQCAVEGRFRDSAISVREAALEIVGRYIASHTEVGLQYFEKVAERIKDTGVSVRKRAIKIIRDLCTSCPDFSGATNAFVEIISRVTDDESSIQDLVCKTFYDLWFEEPSGSQIHFVDDGSSVPIEVAKKAEQIVDTLKRMPNQHHLVTIIKRNLALDFLPQSAKATGISAVSLARVRKRCELICKRLLERILQVEEGNSKDEEVHALPYVMALHAFCVVDPTLCAPATDPSKFLVTLQPYLKSQVDNPSIAKLLENIVFVIDAVLPFLRKPPESIVKELEQDLRSMIVRHSFLTVVHVCIKCLCSLSKIAGRGATLIEFLIQAFYKQLNLSDFGNNQLLGGRSQLLGRSLFCLGLLIRYGNDLTVSNNDERLHIGNCLALLKNYLLLEDFSLKIRALQALGYVLIAKPECMLEIDIRQTIETSLSSGTDSRLKMQMLQNLYEYLVDAESQLGAGGIKKETHGVKDTSNIVPEAAGAGDTNICGGIIQLFWPGILEVCVDVNNQVRQSALKIMEIALRQGLVHPISCVPCLIALETDPYESNSKLAHHLLMNLHEKHPAFFESRFGDGLKMSFGFVQSIKTQHNLLAENVENQADSNDIAHVKRGISCLYRLTRGNRTSRNKLMHSIIRKFESDTMKQSSIPFLVYCTAILASLPFTCPDEPLYLIYDINRVVQLRAGSLEANMKTWSSFSQQQVSSDHPGERVKLNTDSNVHIPEYNATETTDLNACGANIISQDGLLKFQADCHDAIAIQLLLRLKRHLKMIYGLNDARCQAFSLKEHPKAGETIARQHISFEISNISVHLPATYQDMVEKYQEFKRSLKEDTIDYATYTSSIKRKRPTSRSTKGGKAVKEKIGKHADQDDDGDDDEDWTGGPRTLNFSDQQSNGVVASRVTRQRV